MFAAVGLASWTVETGARPNAPVILIPITAIPTDAARWDFKIELSGDPQLNPVVVHVLRTEHSIELPEQDSDLVGGLPKSFTGLLDLLSELKARWVQVRGIGIEGRIVVGNFSYLHQYADGRRLR